MSQPTNNLQYNPYEIFYRSTTPPGLYARQKWLKEASSQVWQADFDARVAQINEGREASGGWEGSPMKTVQRLFDLHLTVRDCDSRIRKSLDWLMEHHSFRNPSGPGSLRTPEKLCGFPFAPSAWHSFLEPATLFLCTIFGRGSELNIFKHYDRMLSRFSPSNLCRQNAASLGNMLRALVVNPVYCKHHVTQSIVSWLADQQSPQGNWGIAFPFYQTVNALAHLGTTEAHQQTLLAFKWLLKQQHSDGTWGSTDREWNTFLAVHALRNKGFL